MIDHSTKSATLAAPCASRLPGASRAGVPRSADAKEPEAKAGCGRFTACCSKEIPRGTRIPKETCYDEEGIRAMLASQTGDRERVNQMRRVCSSRAACGSNRTGHGAAAAILRRVRRLNEFFYRLRWGRLEERRRRGLVRLHDLLAKTEFADRYWMIMGLLLGCMRDGAPIPWDRDSDFGFMDQDLPAFLAAMQVLRDAGYNLRPPQVNNDGRTTMWTLKYEAVKYDFFMMHRNGENFRWYCHQRKPPLELVNEVPAHGLAAFVLYDRQWRVPDNAEDLLKRIYGEWRHPNPDYVYWRDCRAIVERYPWTGERRPPD